MEARAVAAICKCKCSAEIARGERPGFAGSVRALAPLGYPPGDPEEPGAMTCRGIRCHRRAHSRGYCRPTIAAGVPVGRWTRRSGDMCGGGSGSGRSRSQPSTRFWPSWGYSATDDYTAHAAPAVPLKIRGTIGTASDYAYRWVRCSAERRLRISLRLASTQATMRPGRLFPVVLMRAT
jgi:hypothetical protein